MGWPTAGEGGEWLPIFFGMTRAIKLFSLLSVLIMLGVGLVACGGSSGIEKQAAELVGKDFECQCHRQFSRSGSPASNAGGSGKIRSLTGTDAR